MWIFIFIIIMVSKIRKCKCYHFAMVCVEKCDLKYFKKLEKCAKLALKMQEKCVMLQLPLKKDDDVFET